jgi:bacterioferritin
MKGDADIIELLNEVLTAELTAVNQYFLDAKMLDNWGYERLGKRFRDESIDEMKDADELIERILRDLLAKILGGEEEHADWLESQLELIDQVGDAHYLAQQIRE